MTESDIKALLQDVRRIAKEEARKELMKYVRITSASVISASAGSAIVRLPYSKTDGTDDFSVKITTAQSVVAGDSVNLAYWGNLTTAIIISK